MENEEYTTNTTKFESELISNFSSEYNKKLGGSLLSERLLKYSNNNQNLHHFYEEKENEEVPPYVDNFMASPEKTTATVTGPLPPLPSATHQIPPPVSHESNNCIELYSKLMNGHSGMGTAITDPEVSRNSIKRKVGEQENIENNDGHYLMKCKKQFSNKISSSYASSIPPDLDLPLDIFNEPSALPVSVPNPAQLNNVLPLVSFPPVPPPPSRTHINPYAIKDCSEEIKKILKEKIKLNKNGGKLMKGLINELGGQINNEYAQYLGLQPAVKFKCFKCGESQFPSLLELKDHQMICLNKNGGAAAKSSNGGNSTNKLNNNCKNNSENSNNKINKLINNNGNSNNSGSHNDPSTKIRITRKVFLCSACGTYYENWNLFLHMREVHQRHTCLYCLGLFATSERLLNHLENKHSIKEKIYDSKEHLITSFNNPCYLMCSNCEHVFSELDNFHLHLCENYLETCTVCGLKYVHKHNCNISNNSSSKAMAVKSTNKVNKEKDKKKLGNNNQSNEKETINQPHNSTPLVNGSDHQQEYKQDGFLPPPPPLKNHIPDMNPELASLTEQHNNSSSASDLNKTNSSSADVNSSVEDRLSSAESGTSSSAEEESESSDDDDGNSPPMGELNQFATIISNTEEILDSSHQQKIVPKLKIKFNSKAFSTPIVSEVESSSDGSDEEEEDENECAEEEEEQENEEESELKSQENSDTNNISGYDVSGERSNPLDNDQMDIEEPGPMIRETAEIKSELDVTLLDELQPEVPREIKIEKTEVEEKLGDLAVTLAQVIKKTDFEPQSNVSENSMVVEKKIEFELDPEPISMDIDEDLTQVKPGTPFQPTNIKTETEEFNDGIVEAGEDNQLIELRLNSPLDRIDIKVFIGICLQSSIPFCLYCNHARRILVNGKALALHLIAAHRYSATVNSITAEELLPSTIVAKLKSQLETLDSVHFSLDSLEESGTVKRDIFAPAKHQFECFQCRFITNIHKELYLHNRKMHLKSILLCIMCKSNFYSYSELICHICPGTYNKVMILDLVFKCCLCDLENIPSAFRLMVHLRKKHNACDVCLEECYDQSRLSNHVWKHKLHHLCYRCGIAYRNKPDITKHLFWKHGTESVVCKKCLQKKWPHVYHFCIPPPMFTCESCSLMFHKAVSLKVHKRLHNGDAKYPCTEDNCDKKFISRKLLLKHVARHSNVVEEIPMLYDEEDVEYNEESEVEKSDENDDSMKSGEEIVDEGDKTRKEKRKKNKPEKEFCEESPGKNVKPVIRDIMDLPALNLSESDTSDEEEMDSKSESQFANAAMSQDNENEIVEEPDANNVVPIMNIWDNFRSFQASQKKPIEDDDGEPNIPPPILHVVQSDHDYSMMYRPLKEIQEDNEDDKKMDEGIVENKEKEKHSPSKKAQKTSDSSSSDSSSGSDSCSCGTDCSCSSSSSGSSSSSSSSDDENNSSSSENRKKLSAAAKGEKIKKIEKKRQKAESETAAAVAAAAAAAQLNESLQQIDVVATDTKINITVDPDSIIQESDLETDESETDEDFYDEHPQKLANQILAEKRRQLMLQTSLNPMNNAIVENSRPSTPSLPEEVVREKRIKLKKKKKKRNTANSPETPGRENNLVPPLKISISNESGVSSPGMNKTISSPILPVANTQAGLDGIASTPPVGIVPALISSNSRLSTGSGSETDGALKRSKRRRIPNRFYGYSSDEEAAAMSVMKPTPPPNLTWRKEDLPSPTHVKTPPVKTLKIRSPSLSKTPVPVIKTKTSRNSSPVNFYPPIPPVIIRPSPQTIPSQISLIPPPIPPPMILAQPPRVEPLRVPAVPVHHILPPEFPNSSFSEYSDNSDSDSSNEGGLQILQKPTVPLKTKIILNKPSMVPRVKKESTKKQLKPPKTPKTPKTPKITKTFTPSSPVAMSAPIYHQTSGMPAQVFPAQQILLPQPTLQPQLIQHTVTIQPPVHHPPPRLPGMKYPLFLPPRGSRTEPKEGESVYCYCQCPYDEVSEMIACDGEDCQIEWFHFECVGIMVPPKGKWYCPDCKPKYLSGNNEYLEEDNT